MATECPTSSSKVEGLEYVRPCGSHGYAGYYLAGATLAAPLIIITCSYISLAVLLSPFVETKLRREEA